MAAGIGWRQRSRCVRSAFAHAVRCRNQPSLLTHELEHPVLYAFTMKLTTVRSTLFSLLAAGSFAGTSACTDDSNDSDDSPMGDVTDSPDSPDAPEPQGPVVPAGELDTTFGTDGVMSLGVGAGIAIDKQGDKLIVCVTEKDGVEYDARLYRFTGRGEMDMTFGVEGRSTLPRLAGLPQFCRDLEVNASGEIAVKYVTGTNNTAVQFFTADGVYQNHSLGGSDTRLGADGDRWLLARTSGSNQAQANIFTTTQAPVPMDVIEVSSQQMDALATYKTFIDADGNAIVISRHGLMATSSLRVQRQTGNVLEEVLPARVSVGDSNAESLKDVIELPDGSLFGVGSADGLDRTLAVRWVLSPNGGEAFTEQHAIGGFSVHMAATLDAMGRSIVVGSAAVNGRSVLVWQRYLRESVTLDTSYGTDGIATLALGTYNASFTSVVELDGAIYAVGDVDAETPDERSVLVKIGG